jgi:hypothetical protein
MNFPSGVTPFAGQLEAVRRIDESFKAGKRYFAFGDRQGKEFSFTLPAETKVPE